MRVKTYHACFHLDCVELLLLSKFIPSMLIFIISHIFFLKIGGKEMINAHPFMFFPTLFFLQSNNGSSVHYPSILLFFFLFLFLLLHIFLKSKIHFISFHMPSLTLEEEKKKKKKK
jgi:hypothetical protein